MTGIARVASLAGALLCGVAVAGQEKPARTLWSGVFTETQAGRGESLFADHCAPCHGGDLMGSDGPALVGDTFTRSWGSRYLDRLFRKIQTRMPADSPQSLDDDDKLEILTFILASNGFPAGKETLPLDAEVLASLQIAGRNGPEPPPAGAIVEVMGCLRGEGKDWTLTNATQPRVSTMEEPETDTAAAVRRALGSGTVTLLDAPPSSAGHTGHKMLAIGELVRGNGLAVRVLYLGLAGTTCR